MQTSMINTPQSSAYLGLLGAEPQRPARLRARRRVAEGLAAAQSKAKATATDFEAMFLNSMFSQMTSGLKGEGPFGDTPGTGVWRSMLTEQYSKNFAKAGGVGVATEVYRTLIMQQAKTIRTA